MTPQELADEINAVGVTGCVLDHHGRHEYRNCGQTIHVRFVCDCGQEAAHDDKLVEYRTVVDAIKCGSPYCPQCGNEMDFDGCYTRQRRDK